MSKKNVFKHGIALLSRARERDNAPQRQSSACGPDERGRARPVWLPAASRRLLPRAVDGRAPPCSGCQPRSAWVPATVPWGAGAAPSAHGLPHCLAVRGNGQRQWVTACTETPPPLREGAPRRRRLSGCLFLLADSPLRWPRHGSLLRAHTVTVPLCVWFRSLCDHATYHTPSTEGSSTTHSTMTGSKSLMDDAFGTEAPWDTQGPCRAWPETARRGRRLHCCSRGSAPSGSWALAGQGKQSLHPS